MSDRELLAGILSELAIATRHDGFNEKARELYCNMLAHWDIPTVSEACSRLMQSAKFFPKIAEINEVCGIIRKEAKADESEDLYAHRGFLPKARAKLWLDHLRATLDALQNGEPRPAPPEPLDTSDVTYRCSDCRDTGFIQACHCGRKDCNLCRYHYVKDCYCKPPRPEPIKTQEKRFARAR